MNENAEVPIRDAATVILLRQKKDSTYVLMGQRGNKAVFMPSKYVFPGGAVDEDDTNVELFKSIENNTECNFFKNRVKKTKMVNTRSKFNQFAFHLSNPLTTFVRDIFLKRLVKNKKFLDSYLGKIYR